MRRRCCTERGEVILEERMDEAIATTDTLQQDALGGFFEKTDVAPGHGSATIEDQSENIMSDVGFATVI